MNSEVVHSLQVEAVWAVVGEGRVPTRVLLPGSWSTLLEMVLGPETILAPSKGLSVDPQTSRLPLALSPAFRSVPVERSAVAGQTSQK